MTPAGLLHSEIHGSMPTYGSPWLIAVSRVLLRLPVPRHSPCALCSLTISYVILSLWRIAILLVTLKSNHFSSLSLLASFLFVQFSRCILVGLSGLEPPTSRLSGVRSNRLSYKPISPASVPTPSPLVEINGIEPLTSCLQSRRSPS